MVPVKVSVDNNCPASYLYVISKYFEARMGILTYGLHFYLWIGQVTPGS
jgi:hypothetical protein